MKIKLVRHPYQDHKIGDVIDLGEEKNKSLVEFQRAVWVEEGKSKKILKKKRSKKTFIKRKRAGKPKKLITNKLRQKIQKKKDEDKKGKGFWDKLK